MKIISIALKIIAIILGVLCILYGVLGIFGINPAGRHEEFFGKLVGLYMVILGCFYFYPNSKLNSNKIQIIYYSVTLSPVFVLLIAAITTIINEGFNYFQDVGGVTAVFGTSVVSIFAPLSLLLYNKKYK